MTLTIETSTELVEALTLGESVAVDGACLTVTTWGNGRFSVDASAETMKRTSLGDRKVGDALHLERALRLGDRLGGHMVTGHVDECGRVVDRSPLGQSLKVTYETSEALSRYIVAKGSIAIDGVSLTVNEVERRRFSVVLIPHTQSIVHLHTRALGQRVNLEADIIGKYVERLLAPRQQDALTSERAGLDLETLARAGFTQS